MKYKTTYEKVLYNYRIIKGTKNRKRYIESLCGLELEILFSMMNSNEINEYKKYMLGQISYSSCPNYYTDYKLKISSKYISRVISSEDYTRTYFGTQQ